jgi:hypothetical protein
MYIYFYTYIYTMLSRLKNHWNHESTTRNNNNNNNNSNENIWNSEVVLLDLVRESWSEIDGYPQQGLIVKVWSTDRCGAGPRDSQTDRQVDRQTKQLPGCIIVYMDRYINTSIQTDIHISMKKK